MGITASSYTLFPDTISCGGEVEKSEAKRS